MSHAAAAVFLSYASQDATAAQRIAETLRAAGVEVWFDQNELVGGDAWDKKIRDQIASCALFVPLISANTQARTEGYFRLEWRLAEQRSFLMAKGRPFLLPIVIDDTPDAGAHVPDTFLEVQWSRFPGGACDAKFAAHVAKLLTWDGSGSTIAAPATTSTRSDKARPQSLWWLWFAIPGMLTGLFFSIGPFWRRSAPPPATTVAPPVSEADQLAARAWSVLENQPLMTRRNVELAEQLVQRALAADPTSAEANAVAAMVNFRYLDYNYEDTSERRANLRRFADTARLLDPESVKAELATCGLLFATGETESGLKRIAALAEREPNDLSVLRTWVKTITWSRPNDDPQVQTALDRLSQHSPLGLSYADSYRAGLGWGSGDYVHAQTLLDGVFARGQPVRITYLIKLLVLTYGWSDLPAAKTFIAEIPAELLLEDVFIYHAAHAYLWSGDAELALEVLNRTERPFLHEAVIEVPIALLRGNVLQALHRPSEARIEWESALQLIEERLEVEPRNSSLSFTKFELLSKLGRTAEAQALFPFLQERFPDEPGTLGWGQWYDAYVHLGELDEAAARFDRVVQRDHARWPNSVNTVRHDPEFEAFRQDPRVQATLARGHAWINEMRAAAQLPPLP